MLFCFLLISTLVALYIIFYSELSCDKGEKMDLNISVNICPTVYCSTSNCSDQCIAGIKADIASKLGSKSFLLNVTLANETVVSFLAKFCLFDPVASGKRDKL